jgi:hypothetical protein
VATEVLRTIFIFYSNRAPKPISLQSLAKTLQTFNFYFLLKSDNITRMFQSFHYEPRKLEATEARLEAIMKAAKLGLKGDSLALAAGMTPTEYRQLVLFDPIAEYAELKGRADGEREMAQVLHTAANEGDAKSALAILQHQHGWVAKQQLSIDVEQRISITAALEQAQTRVIDALSLDNKPQTVEFKEIKEKLKAA